MMSRERLNIIEKTIGQVLNGVVKNTLKMLPLSIRIKI